MLEECPECGERELWEDSSFRLMCKMCGWHEARDTPPAEPDTWNCPRPECGAEMFGGLFCRTCGQARS